MALRGQYSRHISHMPRPDTTTTKIPPFWEPSLEQQYPFRIWLQDIELWLYSTEVPVNRQAPAIVLRLDGTARALAREIPVQTLANGANRAVIPAQYDAHGQPVEEFRTGTQILLDLLKRRFHPFEQESQIRVLNDFFKFRREHSEDCDALLSRFELVLYRAQQTAQFTMSEVGKSWMVLHHLRVPMEKWPLLLVNTNGNLPTNEAEYTSFCEYLRRNVHLWEGVGEKSLRPYSQSAHHTGYWANEGDDNDDDNHDHEQSIYYDHDDYDGYQDNYDQDHGSYFSDGPPDWDDLECVSNSSLGDDEDRRYENMADHELMAAGDGCPDVAALWSSPLDDDQAGNLAQLFMANYRRAKARVKRFFNRKPRRFVRRRRFGGKRGRKGKGFGKFRSQFLESPAAYKGSKGFRKGKGKGKSEDGPAYLQHIDGSYFNSNPKDRSGEVMKCHSCGSTDHLIAKCPKNRKKGKGSYYDSYSQQYYAEPPGTQNALEYDLSGGTYMASSVSSDPHMLPFDDRRAMFEPAALSKSRSSLGIAQNPTTSESTIPVDQNMVTSGCTLTSDGFFPSKVHQNQVTSGCTLVSDGFSASSPNLMSEFGTPMTVTKREHGPARLFDMTPPRAPPPGLSAPWNLGRELSYESQSLDLAVPQPKLDLYPVWIGDRSLEAANLDAQYHLRSRLSTKGREGLLVDPGAILNLCGDKWMKRQAAIAKRTGRNIELRSSKTPMRVEGVGKGSQPCTGEVRVPICLKASDGTTRPNLHYEASYIAESEIPALLGLNTLKKRKAVLDCFNGILFEMGADEYQITLPPGSTRSDLEQGESGHWILPCSDWPELQRGESSL